MLILASFMFKIIFKHHDLQIDHNAIVSNIQCSNTNLITCMTCLKFPIHNPMAGTDKFISYCLLQQNGKKCSVKKFVKIVLYHHMHFIDLSLFLFWLIFISMIIFVLWNYFTEKKGNIIIKQSYFYYWDKYYWVLCTDTNLKFGGFFQLLKTQSITKYILLNLR